MMQSSSGIRERIDHILPSLRPAERAVAQYIRDHLDQAGGLTVGQMAAMAKVSQPTVIRFSRKLGFDGYRELRYVLQYPQADHELNPEALAGLQIPPVTNSQSPSGEVVEAAHRIVDSFGDVLDGETLRKAIAAMSDASLIDIYADGSSTAQAVNLHTKLSYLGLPARFNADDLMQQVGAGHLSHGNVAIGLSQSGRGNSTVNALHLASNNGAKTIAIVERHGTALANYADIALEVGNSDLLSGIAEDLAVNALYLGMVASDYGRFSSQLEQTGHLLSRILEDSTPSTR